MADEPGGQPPTDPTPPAGQEPPATGDDTAAELEKWRALARKHEDRAKANATAARELEALKQRTMTDTEKAVAAAKAEGRAEALREAGSLLVDAKFEAAAAGRGLDVPTLLEGLDRTAFLDADGQPDAKKITAWVDKVAPARSNGGGFPDLGQGARTPAAAGDMNTLIRHAAGRA